MRLYRRSIVAPVLLLVVGLYALPASGQSRASGIKLTAPPRSLRATVAVPTPTASPIPTTADNPPPAVATPTPTGARSSLAPQPNTRLPYTGGDPATATPFEPRRLFSPAASTRTQQPPTDPFSNAPSGGARPFVSETVPSSPAEAPIKLGTDDDVFIEAPNDGYFGDSRFPYDPSERLDWTPQFLPAGLIYRSYLAGVKESRMASVFDYDSKSGWIWDITLGARVGLFRFGSTNPIRPEGFQIDLEGSAQPRLDLDQDVDLLAVDFRSGLPITYGIGRWSTKFAIYHLSAHAGDEYLVRNPGFQRRNYVRDEFVLGQSYYITDDLRLYAEAGWAFNCDYAKPWEFQFGADYSPLAESNRGAPFAAINGYIRQEQNFSGNLVVQAGWQWRPWNEGKLLRVGLQYYNGKSNQFEFYDRFENKVGLGIWYDF